MGFEIEFLAVGEGEKSGDAIALRYGNLHGSRDQQTVVVIDGGTKDSGQALVNHITRNYGTETVDFVFLTHPDGDHASGLSTVVEQLNVGVLVMHQPWNHAVEIRDLFHDGRITPTSLEVRIRASLQAAHDLEKTALKRDIKIVEPFQGMSTTDGALTVLGPSRDYYQSLIPEFRRTPQAKVQDATFFQKAVDAITRVAESMHLETLTDSGETSAENDSSAITLFKYDGQQVLFTGDAGIPALSLAADYADTVGFSLDNLNLLDVPHHGSKRNVGPSILNRVKAERAVISASSGGEPKHPAKKVINALIRRGNQVYATQGITLRYAHDAPERAGMSSVMPFSFFSEVEE